MVEDRADRDAGVEGAGDAQLLDPHRLDVGQGEFTRLHLNGADAALVGRPCRPYILEATHHRNAVILREVFMVVS